MRPSLRAWVTERMMPSVVMRKFGKGETLWGNRICKFNFGPIEFKMSI